MKKVFQHIKTVATVVALITVVSCSKESLLNYFNPVVDVTIPANAARLVLVGRIVGGSDSIELFITKSRGALDTTLLNSNIISGFGERGNSAFDTVNSAVVKVFKDGVLFATLQYFANGKYLSKLSQRIPEDRSIYTVQVSAAGLATIEATQQMVSAPTSFDTITVLENVKVAKPLDLNNPFDPLGDPYNAVQFNLTFKDKAGEQNYYSAFGTASLPNDPNPRGLRCESRDPASENNYLNAKNLDGKVINWTTHTRRIGRGGGPGGGGPKGGGGPGGNNAQIPVGTVVNLTLVSASYDRYLFEQSYATYLSGTKNPFAEPVILHSNVKNGFGVFTTAVERTKVIRF
jgi:Domain of unknown function (DUF4249)